MRAVPMCSILGYGHYRIVQIGHRVVQGPFRYSKKQHTSYTDLPSGKIGHHMGQYRALALAWEALFRNCAVAETKWRFWRLRGPKPPWMMAIFPRKYERPLLPCSPSARSCYRPAARATLQRLCRKGYAVWGYAAGAMLQESWMIADDDDGW